MGKGETERRGQSSLVAYCIPGRLCRGEGYRLDRRRRRKLFCRMIEGYFVDADRRWGVWVSGVVELGAWRVVVVGGRHVVGRDLDLVGMETVDHGKGGGGWKGRG